jgi:integrase/recombinase XerD
MGEKRKSGRPKGTTKNSIIKYLDEDQQKKFLRAVRGSKSERDDLMFTLILFLGLRASEVQKIKLSDINFDSFQITIAGLKSGRVRTYDLGGKLWRKLEKWMKGGRKKIDPKGKNLFLFPSRLYHDEPITAQAIKFSFKRFAKEAGLNDGFSVHSLRHSCGVNHALDGETPIEIMKWLRHRNVASTQVYFDQVEFKNQDQRAKDNFSKFL